MIARSRSVVGEPATIRLLRYTQEFAAHEVAHKSAQERDHDSPSETTLLADPEPTVGTVQRPSKRPKEEKGERREGSTEAEMLFGIWLEEFGGNGRKPQLTDQRRKKLYALWGEQLRHHENPESLFRSILVAVKASDHHMGVRDYQFPESLFKNVERREKWALKGTDMLNGTGPRSQNRPTLRRLT